MDAQGNGLADCGAMVGDRGGKFFYLCSCGNSWVGGYCDDGCGNCGQIVQGVYENELAIGAGPLTNRVMFAISLKDAGVRDDDFAGEMARYDEGNLN